MSYIIYWQFRVEIIPDWKVTVLNRFANSIQVDYRIYNTKLIKPKQHLGMSYVDAIFEQELKLQ